MKLKAKYKQQSKVGKVVQVVSAVVDVSFAGKDLPHILNALECTINNEKNSSGSCTTHRR